MLSSAVGAARKIRWKVWDLWHGIETTDQAEIASLTTVGGNRLKGNRYEASSASSVKAALTRLQIDYSQYSFVDLGSGKGRVLLVASEFAFREIIGVEFSLELHEIAESNIRNFRGVATRNPRVRSVLSDAMEFNFPRTPLVLYFFNPFAVELVSEVIRRAQEASGFRVHIICAGRHMPEVSTHTGNALSLLRI